MRPHEHAIPSARNARAPGARCGAGFTLMELLVVVAIIGILVGIVLGVSGYANRKSAGSRSVADMERIKTALEEYRIAYGRYFGPANGTVISLAVGGVWFTNEMSKYVKDLSYLDPWGRAYLYSNSTEFAYRLWSDGPNQTNTADDLESGVGYY